MSEENQEAVGHVFALPAESIHRSPYQVRREDAADPELAASIKAHGLVHPVTVREDGKGGYELIAGHRRLAAYRAALPGAPIPAIVLSVDDREAEDLLVSENFMRLDLSLVEKAVTIARLLEHGRTTAQVAELVRMSERTVFRLKAVGTLANPWREFLHAWSATYEEALRLARLPAAVQTAAWDALLDFLADELTYTVRKGNKEDETARASFRAALEGLSDDKAGLLDYLVRAAPPGMLPGPKEAEDLVHEWFDDEDEGLAAFLGEQRLLDPKTCPFDCKGCKGCMKRSDVQRELFDEDDPARTTPRCHDADCWAAKVAKAEAAAKAKAAKAAEAAAAPGTPPAEAGGATAPEPSSSPAPAPRTDAPSLSGATAGKDRRPARAEDSPLSREDFAARMGAVWAVARLLGGDKIEDLLPAIGGLSAEPVARGGWIGAVRRDALPRFKRNRDEAEAVLNALVKEGAWE